MSADDGTRVLCDLENQISHTEQRRGQPCLERGRVQLDTGSGIASGGDARTAEQIAHLLKPQLQFQVIGAVCNQVKDVVKVWQHCQRQQKENQQNRRCRPSALWQTAKHQKREGKNKQNRKGIVGFDDDHQSQQNRHSPADRFQNPRAVVPHQPHQRYGEHGQGIDVLVAAGKGACQMGSQFGVSVCQQP